MTGQRKGPADGERLARAALTRVMEPGDAVLGRRLADLGATSLWQTVRTGQRLPEVPADRWAGLRARAANADPSRDLAVASAIGGRFLCPGDWEWPQQLDDLGPARPVGLWVRGTPSLRLLALRSVAVVGARACTDYGAHVAAELGSSLAERGWTVVSGGAYGVDGAAHRGVLAIGGSTVAVLACGVDVDYPAAHRQLLARVAAGGLLVTELPPGTRPTRSRFVQRNRVIAALTRGTVVVEAAVRSGSLITARRARELGRPVMGVPGSVLSGLSAGVHRLLREDAILVSDADQVIELTGAMGELAPVERAPAVARDLLCPRLSHVLDALPREEASSVPDIARQACTSPEEAEARLRELNSLGFVERTDGQWKLSQPATRHAEAPGSSP